MDQHRAPPTTAPLLNSREWHPTSHNTWSLPELKLNQFPKSPTREHRCPSMAHPAIRTTSQSTRSSPRHRWRKCPQATGHHKWNSRGQLPTTTSSRVINTRLPKMRWPSQGVSAWSRSCTFLQSTTLTIRTISTMIPRRRSLCDFVHTFGNVRDSHNKL